MTTDVPQEILDALTDVAMPQLPPERAGDETLDLAGLRLPVVRAPACVLGSGAAGLRAAVEMARRGIGAVVLSQSAWGGTSACSGSDKQTLHTANTADQGDDFQAMAQAIAAGGAMDADTAYVEAVGSVRAMASLQYLGLPLPQDRFGGTLRYRTDHDEVGRATSCGPRTSRLMVKVLAEEALRLGVPILNRAVAVAILAGAGGVQGLLALRPQARGPENPLGLVVVLAPVVVLAAGGPGEMYRDSVYPNGCFGALGLALEAGISLVNLTESQFGIGSRREDFPWNLSGTYVQALPHIYSLDVQGREDAFLARYYRSTQEMVSNIFRKGYQWPFHASRTLDFGSSLLDLAVSEQTRAGRRVFMDFRRNPLPVPGDQAFSLDRLDADAGRYLATAGARQDLPIQRLARMNPLAIELYRRAKIDIATVPLEFAVNNQHMNGGVAVDVWGRSDLAGCYAVGEAAGTHGVTRPGGAALNAGQVFGTRAAEDIAAGGRARLPRGLPAGLQDAVARALAPLRGQGGVAVAAIRAEVQARMSDAAGIFCTQATVAEALAGAQALTLRLAHEGIACPRPADAARALQWRQMALASQAVLAALDHHIAAGGGSRGARAIGDPAGTGVPMTKAGALETWRFRPERASDRDGQIVVRLGQGGLQLSTRPNRSHDPTARNFFERDWPAWLTGAIHAATQDPSQPPKETT